MIRNVLTLAVVLALCAASVIAETRRVRPDGHIQFSAATEGPTRISVKGDRIKDLVQTDSQFEMGNDENTGDVFLRYIGSSTQAESGYLITERGHTIGVKITPKPGLDQQTILVELIGVKTELPSEGENTDADDTESSGFAVSGTYSDSYEASLTEIVKEAVTEKIGHRSASKMRVGGTVATVRKGELTAKVLIAKAVNGGRPAPQNFYSARTVAVWVDDVVAAGKVWVVVVEKRK